MSKQANKNGALESISYGEMRLSKTSASLSTK